MRIRMGGLYGADDPGARDRLAAALGPHGRLLENVRGAKISDAGMANAWIDLQGSLHLSRDAIGHRSLFWSPLAGGGVAFASSIQALLATGLVRSRLSPVGLALYLSCAYVPGERTLLEDVFALRGGEELIFEGPRRVQTWSLPPSPEVFDGEENLRAALRETLSRAVSDRLPAPGSPVGASLSGGIDSSAVVALIRRLHDGPLTTYSVWFGPEHAHELEFSRAVAEHVGAVHRVVEIRPEQVIEQLDRTTAALAEPNGDPLTVPNSLIFREAAKNAPVLFNGEGGDPCFGGPKNAPMLLAALLGDRSPASDYLSAHQRCFDDLEAMLDPRFAAGIPRGALEAEVSPWLEDPRWPGFLDRLMAINVTWKGAHHILPKVDQLAFAEGITPESPLFDQRVVELAFAIPGTLKRRGAEEKYLLKRAVEDLLPRAIIERPKSGMMVPVEAWFSGPLLAFAKQRLYSGRLSMLRPEFVRELVEGKKKGLRPRRGIKIWLLLTLESWIRSLPAT